MAMFSVYILYSSKLNRHYIGSTDNVDRRLLEHNSKAFGNAFTGKGIPWEIYLRIDNLDSKQAYLIELHIKRMKSANYINNLKRYPELIKQLIDKYR